VYLNSGEYLDRFAIMFTNPAPLGLDDNELDNDFEIFYNNESESVIIHNPKFLDINKLDLFNILGQSIYASNDVKSENYTEVKMSNLSSGTYIINLTTERGKISKKVLVK
jgi:hypothetical protein